MRFGYQMTFETVFVATLFLAHLAIPAKWVFRSARATHCPDKRQIWNEGADHRAAPRAKFHVYRGKNVGI